MSKIFSIIEDKYSAQEEKILKSILNAKRGSCNVSDCFRMLLGLAEAGGQKTDNFIFSPASLCCVLRLVAHGANGTTREEIEKFTGTDEYRLASEAVNLYNFLVVNNKIKEEPHPEIRKEYLNFLKDTKNLNAAIYELTDNNLWDLVNEINRVCAEVTNGQIMEAVQVETFLRDRFIMMAANVIHFKGSWESICPVDNEFVFRDVNGSEHIVDAVNMNDTNAVHCYESGNLKAFSAPYREADGRYTFWGFLSDRAVISEEFKSELENLRRVHGEPHVRIPKFKFESNMDMVSQLKTLGVEKAFDKRRADFSKGFLLPADWNVYVSDVCQRAKIDFNEKGTEASAVTEIFCRCATISTKEIYELDFDRPFYFMIWDSMEEAPLFVGQIYEPCSK